MCILELSAVTDYNILCSDAPTEDVNICHCECLSLVRVNWSSEKWMEVRMSDLFVLMFCVLHILK